MASASTKYRIKLIDGKPYAIAERAGRGPIPGVAPIPVTPEWVKNNKSSIYNFSDLIDNESPAIQNVLKSFYTEESAEEKAAQRSRIEELEKQLSEKTDPVSLEEPATQSQDAPQDAPQATPKTEPNTNDTRGMFTMNESLGPNDPKDKSVDGRGIRRAKKSLLDGANQSLNIDIKNSLRDKKTRQLTLDQLDDIAKTWATSETGRRSGIPFENLDPETKNTMINRFVDFRTRGRTKPQQAPTSAVRQNIPQEDFDNMSESDLERELTGVTGGAYESPRIKLEDLTVPQSQGLSQGINNQVNALKRASEIDPNNQEIKDSLNAFENIQFEKPTPPAPTVTPSPDDFQIEPQGTGYDRSRDRAFVESQVQRRAPDNLEMPYKTPQETEFKTQVRPPQYDRAKDLSMVQNQTSLETPAMPKPEFITRENNAPAPAPAPAPEQGPKERMVPIYGASGIVGYRPYSEQRQAAQAYAKDKMKNSRFSSLGDVDSAGMDKLYPTLNTGRIKDQINKETIERFRNNNPFGTEYRPAPTEYLGPVAKSPTPRTTQMMRDINAMPKKQQLDVINSFRRHRGEDDLYNPFA